MCRTIFTHSTMVHTAQFLSGTPCSPCHPTTYNPLTLDHVAGHLGHQRVHARHLGHRREVARLAQLKQQLTGAAGGDVGNTCKALRESGWVRRITPPQLSAKFQDIPQHGALV